MSVLGGEMDHKRGVHDGSRGQHFSGEFTGYGTLGTLDQDMVDRGRDRFGVFPKQFEKSPYPVPVMSFS